MHRRVNWCVRPIIWFRPAARCLGKYLHLANLDLHHACLTHRRRKSKKSILPDLRRRIKKYGLLRHFLSTSILVVIRMSVPIFSPRHIYLEPQIYLKRRYTVVLYHYQIYSLISTIHFLIGKSSGDEAGAMQVRHP